VNHCIKVNKVAAMVDISHHSAHLIFYKMLKVYKVSARQVPRQFTPELKERHNGYDSWVHYFQLETKQTSKLYHYSGLLKPPKLYTHPHLQKK
jgi:hypothetical protein